MATPGERCPARTELSDLQILWLKRRPYPGLQVRRHHDCQLEFRHDGPHADLGQQSDGVEWWIRWTLTSSAVEQAAACAAIRDEPDKPYGDVICVHFEGHPGRHSFDLEPW